MMQKKPELLAPAGSKSALTAAVQGGADAVYLGGPRFNARQSAENFTIEEMKKWVDYCHLYGVLVYVTVNVLIKEKEIPDLCEYAKELVEANVDGVIVQDLGAVSVFQAVAPSLPVHASTQMTVTSKSGAEFVSSLGINRIVLARELGFDKIKEISDSKEYETEIFVHGALCMSYSGQCLMSSIIGGRSGNRGRCAQPCRLPYELLEDGKKCFSGFLLSPKDLCLADEMKSVINTKTASLKIEGRLKRGEYVASVTDIYRKYLDTPQPLSPSDKQVLLDAFNRGGFTKGFFKGETGKKMMCHDNSSNASGNKFSETAKKMAQENVFLRKVPIYMHAEALCGQAFKLTLWDNYGHCAFAEGSSKIQKANERPTGEYRIKTQLSKLGQTPFEAEEITVLEDGGIIPVSEINAVRREAVSIFEKELAKRDKAPTYEFTPHAKIKKEKSLGISVDVLTAKQAETAKKCGIERIYVPYKIYENLKGSEFIPKLPDISDCEIHINSEKVCVQNLGDIFDHRNKKIYGGMRLGIYNSHSISTLGLENVTVSPELNLKEAEQVCTRTTAETEIIAYGRLPLMMMANCPVKACGKCTKNGKRYSLKDRTGSEFPLICTENCRSVLLNSKPVFMADKWESLKTTGADFANLVFTTENAIECEKVINMYKDAMLGKKVHSMPENTFTRGHFSRGVQ